MSDFQPASAPPPPEGYGTNQPSRGPKPASVTNAINILWGLVALNVISAIATFFYLDEIVDVTLEGSGGAAGVTEDVARSGAIIGVVVGLAIGVALYALMAYFLGQGKNWARIVVTVLGGLGLLFGLIGLATGLGAQPVLLTLISIVSLVLVAAMIFFLWKKESSQWFTGRV